MSFQPGGNLYTVAFGTRPESVEVPHIDTRAPASTDVLYAQGKWWINQSTNSLYNLTSFSTSNGVTTANWTSVAGGGIELETLTGDTGTATPSAGNIKIAGTADEITTAASGSTVTLSIPSTFVAPGTIASTTTITSGTSLSSTTSITAGTTITATLGNITATNGNVVLGTAGNKLNSTSVGSTTSAGANSFGTVALASGTATVDTSAVTASSMIFLTCQALGTVTSPSALCVSAKTAGTSFVITASQDTDTSTIAWFIVN